MNKLSIQRFVSAHQMNFDTALNELYAGRKMSHWMWYIFPQIKGLGMSEMSMYYAIQSIDEARAYINNSYLQGHMNMLLDILLSQDTSNATEIFASPDDMKLKSSICYYKLLHVHLMSHNLMKMSYLYAEGYANSKTADVLFFVH